MLSGVGPSAQLQAQNITVVMDQPHVGQGMHDNPMNAVFIPSPVPVEVSLIEVVGITSEGTYVEAAGGENFGGGGGSESNSMKLSSAQPFQGGFILEKVMGPLSTGHMELRTKNPNDNPVVTFNYFQHPDDLKRCVRGIQTIERVVQSKAFARYKYADMSFEYLLNLTASTPVNLRPPRSGPGASLPPSAEEFCQHTVTTIWHYHGGCVVGRVVDGDYKVIGIYWLRVIDMSTVGYCPGTNPQATVMMLGRYMGVKITRERLANK
ncbi:hypothetical protein HID58_064683 [Brassica napus]|uniref:BnaCnng31540D protein n=4 Tax=Brassica TaxID=3705 RepID=A0A078IYA2_BRANA|nr:hypothetical protein HID58_064683 [Brassica napus]CAF1925160.1 unnamed protein product [Brassica napus]CDY57073.1 BnaCnng31540D [Brassica napus]